jgi:apolipoprotein N-acyltransferase
VSGVRGLLQRRGWVYAWALLVVPLIYGASFPLRRIAWLGWVGFVPWFVAIRVARTPAALVICCVSTLLGSYLCTPWLARAVATYYQQPLVLGLALFAGVYALTVGPYVIAFTLCYRALGQRPSIWLPLLAGAAWAGAEVARTRLFVGDPFGLFGYSQVDLTPLVQIADITGVYGVTFLPMAVNAALAELWLARAFQDGGAGREESTSGPFGSARAAPNAGGSRWRPRVCTVAQAWRGVALVGVTVLAAAAYGIVRVHTCAEPNASPSTRVAIVQGNLDLGSQWRQEFYGRNLAEYMRLTVPALRTDRPQLVFWPESAMTFFLEDEPSYRAALGYLLSPTRTQLIVGGPRAVGASKQQYYNSGFLVAPNGSILAAYDKQWLLPFAEYFPFGGIDLLRREFARVREFTPGGPARILPTVAGPAGVVICNEAMFGEIVTERVRAGARYLVNLANDSWLGDAQYAEEAFDMARMRAVEQRRYLVRASTSGPSAIVDPTGRVVMRTNAESRATIAGIVHPATTLTVYARCGDAFGMLCIVVPIGAIVVGRLRDRWRYAIAPARSDDRVASGAA